MILQERLADYNEFAEEAEETSATTFCKIEP
jgi:hypothetical protein